MLASFNDDEQPTITRMNNRVCKNCKHFCPFIYDFDDGGIPTDYGECRRFPPKRVPAEESGYPVVEQDMWCGEFDI